MDKDSEGSSFLNRLGRLFAGKNATHVEQAIIEASQEGELAAAEESMLLNILHLDDLKVENIMTPRADIKGTEAGTSVAEAIARILECGHSRMPIYQDSLDNIVGIIYAKDLLREAAPAGNQHRPVTEIMRQPFFVPETKNAMALLNEFKARKTHMAVILDEYGGTSGLVTIEDVLEEIVGEIEDEHDAPKEAEIVPLNDGSVKISGRAALDEINQALGINLESDEVDTIGGLLSHIAGRLPQAGENFTLEGRVFTVEKADKRRVYSVFAHPMPAPADEG
ncbi:MAG: hemolysin family protein [Deltaproteobacteria bacterium]|nr:hemolysin family protein [Deltaproteobacteria bacterium]